MLPLTRPPPTPARFFQPLLGFEDKAEGRCSHSPGPRPPRPASFSPAGV
ncbi:hypothetical protein SAMN05442782_7076 [Streptomyces sp. OK228]|nr:hypothetical protein SAMN05442782_7076 [Streptomyces sp. OK228]